MATGKKNLKNFCDSLYTELHHMKIKLERYATIIEQGKGEGKDELIPYVRHLHDIVSFIDWKMEIFNKVSPIEWSKLGERFESEVSVPSMELKDTEETPGGYLGG